jgi:hypothetical protein
MNSSKSMNRNSLKAGLLAIAAIAAIATTSNTTSSPTASSSSQTAATPSPINNPVNNTDVKPANLKTVESAGKTYASALMKGQQAFFLEKSKFGNTIEELDMGVKSDTEHYKLEVVDVKPTQVKVTVTAKKEGYKSFTASVFAVNSADNGLPVGIVCGTDQPSQIPPELSAPPKSETDVLACPAGSSIAS